MTCFSGNVCVSVPCVPDVLARSPVETEIEEEEAEEKEENPEIEGELEDAAWSEHVVLRRFTGTSGAKKTSRPNPASSSCLTL